MKKVLCLFMSIFFCFSCLCLTACGCEHEWELVSDTATCGKGGIATYHCNLCDKTKKEDSPSTGNHNFEEGDTVDPTRYGEGYTKYVCSGCGKTEKRNETRCLMDEAKYGLENVIAKLKSKLKDPESLMYSVTCYTKYNSDHTKENIHWFVYDINYNAKNSFGGYVGYQHVYYGWNSAFNSVFTTSYSSYMEDRHTYYFSK